MDFRVQPGQPLFQGRVPGRVDDSVNGVVQSLGIGGPGLNQALLEGDFQLFYKSFQLGGFQLCRRAGRTGFSRRARYSRRSGCSRWPLFSTGACGTDRSISAGHAG